MKPRNLSVRSREYLTPQEVATLCDAVQDIGRLGLRDWLLILTMYRHALRAGELVDLRWAQFHLHAGKLHVNRLKNGDPSVHYLEGDEIRAFRKLRREYPESDFVFCTERGGPLSTRPVHTIVARAGREGGLQFPVHPHMLRHAKGYQLVGKGIDSRAIQAYTGHKSIQHPVLYTRLDSRRFKGFGRD